MENELKNYQFSAFFSPLLDEKQLGDAVDKIKQWIAKQEGQTSKEKISKKGLAYKIKHFQDASYIVFDFSLVPDKIAELSTSLNLNKDVLRHLITSIKAKKKQAKKAKAKSTTLRPADQSDQFDKVDELIADTPKESVIETKPLTDHAKEEANKTEKVDLKDLDKKLDEILNQ